MSRRRPHFRICASIKRDSKLSIVWSRSDLLAAYVRLGDAFVEHYASQQGDVAVLTMGAIKRICGCSKRDKALRTMRELQLALGLVADFSEKIDDKSTTNRSDLFTIFWPKFAESQGFKVHQEYKNTRVQKNKVNQPANKDIQSGRVQEFPAAGRRVMWGASPTPLDVLLTSKELADLTAIASLRLRREIHSDWVQAWFLSILAPMRARDVKESDQVRTARRWVANTTIRDFERAVRRVEEDALAIASEEMSAAAERREAEKVKEITDEIFEEMGLEDDAFDVLYKTGETKH